MQAMNQHAGQPSCSKISSMPEFPPRVMYLRGGNGQHRACPERRLASSVVLLLLRLASEHASIVLPHCSRVQDAQGAKVQHIKHERAEDQSVYSVQDCKLGPDSMVLEFDAQTVRFAMNSRHQEDRMITDAC